MPPSHVPGPNVARGAQTENDNLSRGWHKLGFASRAGEHKGGHQPGLSVAVNVQSPKRSHASLSSSSKFLKKSIPTNACAHVPFSDGVFVKESTGGQVELNPKLFLGLVPTTPGEIKAKLGSKVETIRFHEYHACPSS